MSKSAAIIIVIRLRLRGPLVAAVAICVAVAALASVSTSARASTPSRPSLSPVMAPSGAKRPFRVVIDPGHGGVDQGAIFDDGKIRVAEKDATLLIARQTADELRRKGYEVVLTRSKDEEVALPRRTAIANGLGADIFLSIHMNSIPDRRVITAQGIETYILNNTSDASSRRLAHLENSVLGGTPALVGAAAAGDPKGNPRAVADQLDLALILKDLRLDANLSESKRLACGVQENLLQAAAHVDLPGLTNVRARKGKKAYRNRGVRQALFHVLLGADMPSALVEAGFLSNPHDRALVLSPQGRHAMGVAIARAVEQYHRQKNTRLAQHALSRCQVH